MANSLRLKLDVQTNRGDSREILVERAKELTGEEQASRALEECIYMALSYQQLVDRRREEIRADLEALETDFHRVGYQHRHQRRDAGLR